jgi:hypothetical protein
MRTIRSFLPLIVFVVLVTACGGSSSGLGLGTGGDAAGNPEPAATAASAPGADPAKPAPPAPGSGGGPVAAVDDAKIIRTGSMALEVSDLTSALRTARDGIVGLRGYVGASTTSNEAKGPSAEITYRIPAGHWEQALDLLRGLNGLTTRVVTEHTEAVEVTGQIVDLQARIANLRASETALQGIAEKASKVSDVLEVQAQLTDTRGQIETLDAQLKDLNDRTAYSALTVTFDVPVVAVDVAAKGWEPTAVVDDAAATMVSILQNLATAGIWFLIVWLPIFLVVGALTIVVIAIARRFGVRRQTPLAMPPDSPVAGEG